ncbi:MAG: electron transfer flavoprotein subunit beta/FixA family protein [Legionellales bacterium]|nr:electron transfer flavoprotein subunit beta/FixA family protein [Legionellales bacterium]
MKILVPMKRVIDAYVNIRVKSDHSGVETANVKMSMNPFDEIAIEEAIRLKEQGLASEIIVTSIGETACQEILRTGLALGADRAVLVQSDDNLQPLTIAKILKTMVEREGIQLVIMGKQAIDFDNNQCGQILAGLLNWPQGTFASKITIHDQKIEVTREIDGGLETLRLNLPAIITTDLRLNEPRYASLPNIMKAKRKPLETLTLTELNILADPRYTIESITPPPQRQAGIKVESVEQLIDKLVNEAKVIE